MRDLQRGLPAVLLMIVALTTRQSVEAQVDVLTYRYDNARSGVNLKEAQLKKSNVNKNTFGKLAFRNVDGNIYAQPLIVSQANIVKRPNPVNVAIVATEHNSLYAFDADDRSPDPPTQLTQKALWQTDPNGPEGLGGAVDSEEIYGKIGANGCADLTTEVGITGTPVIKLTHETAPKQGVIFFAAKSKAGSQFTYRLFALNLADGKPVGNGLPIEGAVSGTNGTIQFDPLYQLNRPALLLEQNILYVAFGGHCDAGNYRGWVFAYDVSDPSAPKKLDVFSATYTERGTSIDDKECRGGIWMSGYGLVAADGNVYFVTGDGTYNVTDPNLLELANSVVKVQLVSGKIQVQDWFTPQNQAYLKTFDADLGSAGTVLVPNSHLLLAGGKEGRFYLIDRNSMGRGNQPALHSFQVTNPPHNRFPNPTKAGDILFWNIHGTPVIWPAQGQQMSVYVMGEEGHLKQYRLNPDSGPAGWKFESDAPFKQSQETVGLPPSNILNDPGRAKVWMPGGFLTVSADPADAGSGIVWATMPFSGDANQDVVRGALRAFDASDISSEIWGSEDSGNANDSLGFFAKFNPPVVANGKVYVAAFQQERIDNGHHRKADGGLHSALVIYGLK